MNSPPPLPGSRAMEHQGWHIEPGGERWREAVNVEYKRVAREKNRATEDEKSHTGVSLSFDEGGIWQMIRSAWVVMKGGCSSWWGWRGLLKVHSVPKWLRWHLTSSIPGAFGTASERACISPRVAGYYCGSLSGSGWIPFCTLWLFSGENVQTSRVSY